jgi:hypothetical protein
MPFLSVGQAQKEVTHNEALQILDVVVGGCVEGPPQSTPPASPAVGSAFLVATGAVSEWAGKDGFVAAWTSGGWRFVNPTEGLQMLDRSTGTLSVYRSGAWDLGRVRATGVDIGGVQVLGPRASAIGAPTGGAVVDAEARATINAVLAALKGHGLIEA